MIEECIAYLKLGEKRHPNRVIKMIEEVFKSDESKAQ